MQKKSTTNLPSKASESVKGSVKNSSVKKSKAGSLLDATIDDKVGSVKPYEIPLATEESKTAKAGVNDEVDKAKSAVNGALSSAGPLVTDNYSDAFD